MSESDNVEVRRQNARQRYLEKAVLTAALCRELEQEAKQGRFPSDRSAAVYWLLSEWSGRQDSDEDFDVIDVAPELRAELGYGSHVVSDLSMVYSAGLGMEYQRDVEDLRASLARYLARDD